MRTATDGTFFLTHAPEAVRRFEWSFGQTAEAALLRAERALGQVAWQNELDVAAFATQSPFHAFVAAALCADEPLSLAGERIRQVLPELHGLVEPKQASSYEHEASPEGGTRTPLLDRTLRALRAADSLAGDLADEDSALLATVLLFSDVAKGGTTQQKSVWRQRLGVDGTVHNEDSAAILDDVVRRVLGKVPRSEDGRWAERALTLCASSGLVGMALRGEVGRDAFADLVEFANSEADGGERLANVWSLVNRCEVTAVRSSLWSEELANAFATEERAILYAASAGSSGRTSLAERVARMRGGALMTSEAPHDVELALQKLAGSRSAIEARLARCRVWYAEPTLGALSLDAALRLIVNLTGRATAANIDFSRPWHLDLRLVKDFLRDERGVPKRYAVRLLETLLAATPIEQLLRGDLGGALVSFPSPKGGEQAIASEVRIEKEAEALLTLLSVYETKPGAAFHQTLKSLCDLYGLRKDDFDRVNNESSYLSTMNAARSDKARLLDFVKPGVIVEVGPGGGVVLELLAERFAGSRIVGLDASAAVVAAHQVNVGTREVGFEMVHGDAFKLPSLFPERSVSSVIFCSVLHEIFSYVEVGDPPQRFQLAAVESLVGAAFRSLKQGGRILIRDGVMPANEPKQLEFLSPSWHQGFTLFAQAYEPRRIEFEELPNGRVRLSAPDLYEFLTTYTWGPASFPYEIREQRAVLPRASYLERLLAACSKSDPEYRAIEVAVPADLASYLQPGYQANIEPYVRIFDASGEREERMPDVNGVWVIEKT
jgi:SAM-dependent methyltransferase